MIPDEDKQVLETAITDLRATGVSDEEIAAQMADTLRDRYGETDESTLGQMLVELGFTTDEAGEGILDDSDSDVLDRYLGDDSPDQLTPDEYDLLLDRNFDGLEDDTEKAKLVLEIVSMREENSEPPTEETAPVVVTDDMLIRDILGDRDLLELIESSKSPYSVEVMDRIKAPGVTLLYDNQRSSRILKELMGVDNGVPIYGTSVTEEANVLYPIPGSYSSTFSSVIRKQIEPEMKNHQRSANVQDGLNKLIRVQDAITNLSDVFGFDDPAELEAFFAAWLMKNSTCRLSGIPGTGKTTVINSAAVIMGNSYGFSESPRFYPRSVPGSRRPDIERSRFEFPNGMTYDVSYSARGLVETVSAWESWRFSDWQRVEYDKTGRAIPAFSGSYTYDFAFLRKSAGEMQFPIINEVQDDGISESEEGYLKAHTKQIDMSPDEFGRILFMHIEPSDQTVQELNKSGMGARAISEFVNRKRRPIDITITATGFEINKPAEDEQYSITGGGETIEKVLMPIHQGLLRYQNTLKSSGHHGIVFRTDLGANEGYYLREAMMRYTYDSRSKLDDTGDYDSNNLESLRTEMLREIGIAKVDNDKRADEILYGMEIQQVSETREGKEVNTFVFDPIPRPIVTQPIKFFNEANRSQAGVEDAVLGLIAEKEVEYRGKTFNSPNFVAWMDTNPHQKANDLAFTDRIDTELFFGTISLGQRNAQLQSRYAGASNSKPDIQLVTRIIENEIESPLRITELGLGSRSIWRFVDRIPFRPPDVTSGYDGLRDIATLSVLFTQRPQLKSGTRNENIQYNIGGRTFTSGANNNPHLSPLQDISRSSVDDVIAGVADTNALIYAEGEATFQPQTLIKRVLGFRFTDSIVKMSRAFAFLRGKEYVGRQEIVDSLPYCLGHRLGRARAEQGTDLTGIDELTVASEQEYIREAIVNGYLLPETGRLGTFSTWDAFFSYCEQKLSSAINYREFETDVLRTLRNTYLQNAGENVTTVHWHLATSVVEREREGITNMHRAHYSKICTGDSEGDSDYPAVLAHYRKFISRPEKHDARTPVAMGFNFSAADYFKVRGQIASDPFLFTDDKAHLLGLIDSRIQQLCGSASEGEQISNQLAVDTTNTYAANEVFFGPRPDQFPWRDYGDAGGAWGLLIGTTSVSSEANSLLGGSGGGMPFGWSYSGASDEDALTPMAGQSHRIMFRCAPGKTKEEADDDRKKRSEQEMRFRDYQMPSLKRLLNGLTGTGVIYSEAGGFPMSPGQTTIPTNAKEAMVAKTYPSELVSKLTETKVGQTIDIDNFLSMIQEVIRVRMSGGPNGDSTMKEILANGGINACFELQHGFGVVSKTTNMSPSLTDLDGLGSLRLWIRMHEIANAANNFVFAIGITSNPAMQETSTDPDGKEIVTTRYVGMDSANDFIRSNYTSDEQTFYDSGNLTRDDLIFYERLLSQAFNARIGSDE